MQKHKDDDVVAVKASQKAHNTTQLGACASPLFFCLKKEEGENGEGRSRSDQRERSERGRAMLGEAHAPSCVVLWAFWLAFTGSLLTFATHVARKQQLVLQQNGLHLQSLLPLRKVYTDGVSRFDFDEWTSGFAVRRTFTRRERCRDKPDLT